MEDIKIEISGVKLYVGDRVVDSMKVTYEELVALYKQYIDKCGKVPTYTECVSKNNLPQGRIVKRVLKENNITYKDFMLQFGKHKKVRTENTEDYQMYLDKFIKISKDRGSTIASNELMNNSFGLPSAAWFVKYCPDKNVKTYGGFIDYCGLEHPKHIWTKEEVAKLLIEYEKKVNRPVICNDLRVGAVGVSEIALNRLFGSLKKAKQELGLMETLERQPLPFSYYKQAITEAITEYRQQTGKDYITWNDLESEKYGSIKINHKSCSESFKREGVDLHAYMKSLGCMMNPTRFSYTYTFDDGERACSNLEYKVSLYLRELGFSYNKDYFRSIKYRTFTTEKSRMDCDYLIRTTSGDLYIEVAGIINNIGGSWEDRTYTTKVENEYKAKMIKKRQILEGGGFNYLFIFVNELDDDTYKELISKSLSELQHK